MIKLIRRFTPRFLRNWLRQPKRSAEYIADRVSFRLGALESVKMRDNWTVRCHPASRKHFEVFSVDPVQRAELDVFIRSCHAGMQFLDVGAHYGLFALAAHHFSAGECRVVCVEASRNAAAVLAANVKANDADNVRVVNAAMGAMDGTLEMLSTGPAGSDYFVSAPLGRNDTVSVAQLSMTTVVQQSQIVPTHIKLDVEGYESDIVPTVLGLLEQTQAILFLELHGPFIRARGDDPKGVIEAIRSTGYEVFTIDEKVATPVELAAADFNIRLVCRGK